MSDFTTIVAEAKASVETAAAEVQGKINALHARIRAATAEADQLQAEYDAALLDASDKAVDIKGRLSVQRDLAAALSRKLDPLLAQRGEARKEAVSKAAEAIAAAISDEGGRAIRRCREAAEAKRDEYLAALEQMQTVQHRVAEEARRLPRFCSAEGLAAPGCNVARYSRSEFLVDEDLISESGSPIPLF
ncbi:MAG: hypothetical protein AB7D39_04310 [Pseudodesulfovibrio sp.]|uniref:hypothetical protein n=1 Tax=Pseudodesulfovibrio sp. TaxID=2035812 RepID=UPI003D148A7F